MIGHLVGCVWRDAFVDAKQEMGPEEIALARSYLFTSYGILVRDDRGKADIKDAIVGVSHETSESQTFRGITFIPAEMVVEILDFGPPKVKKLRKRRGASQGASQDTPLPPLTSQA